MDGVEKATPAPTITTPTSADITGPAVASCCPTASFPPDVVWSWMRNRLVLAGTGLVVGGSGLALGWGWLTAIGVAPLIVSAGPCLVMCALGLCMMGRNHQMRSGSPDAAPADPLTPPDRNTSS